MTTWKKAAHSKELPLGSKGCVKFDGRHIALFHYKQNEWYAVQNKCPHDNQEVLSRGLAGDRKGEPKIVCPLHKHSFSLRSGKHLGGEDHLQLETFPIKLEDDFIYVGIED
ncbi:MAG: nitrite reductase (NADH) small subunit [bacterium]|jgi:nitrite reductase (NADH) small subunit